MESAQPGTTELHCVCGARRVVPAGLRIVSCIKCGQALGPPLPAPAPRPAIYLLAVAASSTQLVSAVVLGLAIAWAARRLDTSSALIAWLIASILGILAGAKAYRRGSVVALLIGAAIDAAIVARCLLGHDRVIEWLHVSGALPYVGPYIGGNAELLAKAIAAFAGVACLASIAAVPQARRYAAWQLRQIELAFRTRRL